MTVANSCSKKVLFIGGQGYKRNVKYHDINERCHDCGIINGNIHHFGCDMERCPKCEEQIIGCECEKE